MTRLSSWQPLVELWATVGPAAEGVILPDGCMDLVTDGEVVVVAGADTRARFFTPKPECGAMWGARFLPGVLPQLLGIQAGELTDQVIPLTTLGSLRIRPDELRDINSLQAALPMECVDPAPIRVATELAQGKNVENVARSAGWSARQLRRLSAEWFGYGPKHLQRVLRVQRAEKLLSRGLLKADVAAACGYADAAHLWRERKALSDVTA